MSGTERAAADGVAVASEQALVAQAVRASLASRDFRARVLRWPGEAGGPRRPNLREGQGVRREVGLMITDLDRWPRLRAASLLLARVPLPWVVLTSAPRGPMWGAVLEAGACLVLPSTTGFDEVCEAVAAVSAGSAGIEPAERQHLVGLWTELLERREVVGQRMQSLTPREHEVLTMLYAGDPVARIAQLLEISPSTVRSQVKAVLRKLQVNTQLGAVAALDDLIELGVPEPSGAAG
jgi:DNA-binding NarL/FixJ family response regulator